jgi:hypothetical protein
MRLEIDSFEKVLLERLEQRIRETRGFVYISERDMELAMNRNIRELADALLEALED